MKKNYILSLFTIMTTMMCIAQEVNDTLKSEHTPKEYMNIIQHLIKEKNTSLKVDHTLEEYDDNKYGEKLDYVIKVESNNNILTLYGYKDGDNKTLIKKNISLERYDVLSIYEHSHFFQAFHWSPLPLSLTTVPFKIRPKVSGLNRAATSGINNLGFNVDVVRWKLDRYFASGHKSNHKLNLGLWVAPMVEELDSIYTKGFLKKDVKSKQLFVSTALTFNYTYNNLTFSFVPLGFDLPTSSLGREWVYKGQRWWGFGIGIDPKIFSTLINK